MEVKTNKIKLAKSQKEAFDFLLNMENYESLMPDDTRSFEIHESGKGFTVGVGNLPNVGMKLKETTPNSQIIFESPSPNFEYYLTLNITAINEFNTEVELDFKGNFNAMIEMMAKKPLTNFIETIAAKLAQV